MVPNSVLRRYNIYIRAENYVVQPCPLCKANVKFCLINFTQKMLMCENKYCDFPFGYEHLKYSPLEFQENIDAARSILPKLKNSKSFTGTSSSASSKIHVLNKVCKSGQRQLLNSDVAPKNSKRKQKIDFIEDEKIKKNLRDLTHLTIELNRTEQGETDIITNEKWLNRLLRFQRLSGVQLLKKQEMDILERKHQHSVAMNE